MIESSTTLKPKPTPMPVPHPIVCGPTFEILDLDPAFGSISAEGFSISPNGKRMSGTYFDGPPIDHSGPFHAFFRTPPGFFANADFPNGEGSMSGRAINDKNDRAGFFRDGTDLVPFVWWHNAPNPVRFVLDGAQLPAQLKTGTIPNGAFAINNAGFVAGAYTGTNGRLTGFVTDGHAADALKAFTVVDAASLKATRVLIRGLNSSREIVGRFDDQTGKSFGFVSLDVAGNYTNCSKIEFSSTAAFTVVGGINDSGQIVGHFQYPDKKNHGYFGFVDPTGQAQGLTELNYPGADATRLNGISNNGDMIGTATFGTTFLPFVCRYGCHPIMPSTAWDTLAQAVSIGMALGASPWARAYGGSSVQSMPPARSFDFSASSPAERAASVLALYTTLEAADDAALRRSRQSLLEYVRGQLGMLE